MVYIPSSSWSSPCVGGSDGSGSKEEDGAIEVKHTFQRHTMSSNKLTCGNTGKAETNLYHIEQFSHQTLQ